jgi:hypothetical protein
MSTQVTTPHTTIHTTIHTTPIAREYRIERVPAGWLPTLVASIRRDRGARDRWQWRPVAPARESLEEQILRARAWMLVR